MRYSVIAPLYDRINGDQYLPYASYLQEAFRRFSGIPVREVLDLGCGTGGIAALLADAGYDMVALDASPDMLSVAREKNAGKNTLLLCQDMRAFELYGTVQAAYSSFDCLNYLRSTDELRRVFLLVRNYVEPGGLFLFDVNTRYRLESVFGNNTFSYEFADGLLLWRNEHCRSGCRFLLDWFSRLPDGTYRRLSETQTEYLHTGRTLCALAKETGFSVSGVFFSTSFDTEQERPEKEFYVLQRLP